MTSSDYNSQRIRDLEDNIARSRELLKEYEEALEFENDPRTKAKYQEDIKRQKEAIAQYQEELDELSSSEVSDSYRENTLDGDNLEVNQSFLKKKFEEFKEKYLQKIVSNNRDFQTYGLQTRGPFTFKLKEIFVQLRLAEECDYKIKSAIINKKGKKGDYKIWDFLNAKDNNNLDSPLYRSMAIIGPPGSGKTTLLQNLSLTLAEKQLSNKQEELELKLFPIIFNLKEVEIQQAITTKKQNLTKLIKSHEYIEKLDPWGKWTDFLIDEEDCLILLDGLDEIGSEQQRKDVSEWLKKQIKDYQKIRFIITSRPKGYSKVRVENIRVTLEVQPFNLEQTEKFIKNWYLHNKGLEEGKKNQINFCPKKVEEEADKESQNLIKSIKKSPALAEMALNPLLLTMIATVHCFKGFLPKRRVDLFAEICDVLLRRRQEATVVSQNLTLEQKKAILQGLALKLMERKKRQFTLEEGCSLIHDDLNKLSDSKIKSKNFIEEIETLSGLLVEKEKGSYEFAHLNFQEYLAAAQIENLRSYFFPNFILNQNDSPKRLSLIVYWIITKTFKRDIVLTIKTISDPWWYETICLYAAIISDANDLIKAALIKSDIVSLNFASDCIEESVIEEDRAEEPKVSPEVIEEVKVKLEKGLESSNNEIFKLAVEVKLARRLKNLLRLDDNFKIDTNYITAAEYKFYLTQRPDRDKSYLKIFNHKKAKQPIKQITWEDSLAFCAWLTSKASLFQFDKTEGNSIDYYRLPTIKEKNDNPILGDKGLGAWTIENENSSQEKSIRIVKVSIDSKYIQLIEYLAAEQWEKADLETTTLIKKQVKCEDNENLNENHIKQIPSEMLCNIDRLWMIYSGGSYGLGVQTKIWETNGNNSFIGCLPSSWCANNFEQKYFLQLLSQKFNDSQIERCEIKDSLSSQIITTYPLEFETVKLNERGGTREKTVIQNAYFYENLGDGITLEMVAIPTGSFMMGTEEAEIQRLCKTYNGQWFTRESPQHKVTVRAFWMSRSPITQAQWKEVAGWEKVERDLDPDPSYFKEDYEGITRWHRPVECVSWDDAIEFCKRLSNRTKREYRLSSEAEWEYACRGGTATPFHFGETISAELANYNGNYIYGQGVKREYRKQTTPVGYFKVANAFGLYDMHGNVWEWCEDDWHDNYQNAPNDATAWISSKSSIKVMRGGSWYGNPSYCRSAYRDLDPPGDRYHAVGFRVVRLAPRT